MSSFFNAAFVSVEMVSRRDRLKELYGDQYANATKDARRIVQGIAERDGKTLLSAGVWVCEQAILGGNGGVVKFVIAATVDLCEEKDKA